MFGEPLSHGGQEAFIFSVLERINMDDLQIDFFTPYYSDNKRYEDLIAEKGGELYTGDLLFAPGSSRKNIIQPLKNVLYKNKYDVVHIHSGSISVLAYAAETAKKMGVNKVIVHSHAAGLNKNIKYRLTRLINNYRLSKYPDVYCACSIEAGEWKFPQKIVDRDLVILKNGINIDKFYYNPETRGMIRNQLDVEEDTILIGQVGRLSAAKNHAFSMKLFQELQSRSERYMMIFVGDGELRDEIEGYINSNGLNGKIILVGNVDNVQDYMNAMDVLLFPSLHEGFGIVAIEAQATGLPVIVSEGIPKSVDLNGKVKFNRLDDIKSWINDIENVVKIPRNNGAPIVVDQKYDSDSVASEVRNLYLG